MVHAQEINQLRNENMIRTLDLLGPLEKHGFTPEWNKKVNSRIFIPDFKWQHIFDEENRDLMNYNYVIDAILGNK